jgi:glucosamine-6-phosphate deaminase
MNHVDPKQLYEWCRIPAEALSDHPELRVAFRVVRDSAEMGQIMARDLVNVIEANSQARLPSRAIIPCGPNCWYAPFTELVNSARISLRSLTVFLMDECLDWQAGPLPRNHP